MIRSFIGIKSVQVSNIKPNFSPSVMVEGEQIDKFAQVMRLCQNLSDSEPFIPEKMFSKEMPEEVKLYLRSIFEKRIQPILSKVDSSNLSDDDIFELSPHIGDTLDSYRQRATTYLQKFNSEGD